jgi:hypothetical protein
MDFTTETQRHSLLSYNSSSCVSVSLWLIALGDTR